MTSRFTCQVFFAIPTEHTVFNDVFSSTGPILLGHIWGHAARGRGRQDDARAWCRQRRHGADEVLEAVRVVLRRLEGTRNRARRPPGDKILPAANPHNHSANLALRLAARLASISEKPL